MAILFTFQGGYFIIYCLDYKCISPSPLPYALKGFFQIQGLFFHCYFMYTYMHVYTHIYIL